MKFLSKTNSGILPKNKLVCLYGPEGVGKSYFASTTNKPLVLGTEGGTENYNITRLPKPTSWDEVIEMVEEVAREDHEYKTFVIDTLDWLEPLLFDKFTKGSKAIEDCFGGYGKWVSGVSDEWRKLMSSLNKVRSKMDVVLLAHSQVKTFNDPVNNAPYDRYELKLHSTKHSNLWKEYVDCLLFANYDVMVKKDNTAKAKAYGTGERKMFSQHRPAFDAKNRDGLPFEMDLSYSVLCEQIELNKPEDPQMLKDWISQRLSSILDESLLETINKTVESAGNDSIKLRAILDRVIEKTTPTEEAP